MKYLHATKTVVVPDGVKVTVEARFVTVAGPRGTLKREFRHQSVEIELEEGGKKVVLSKWLGNKTELANLQTFTAHIKNMILGVTQGYRYSMRLVYAHFPINANPESAGKLLEIRNFLGEKRVRRIPMRGDTKIIKSAAVKDELLLEGNSIEDVAQSAADVHRSCLVKKKDLRKFLDGIYVAQSGPIPKPQ